MIKQIITVTGPANPTDMGVIDAHSHVWIEPVPGGHPAAPMLFDEEEIISELKDYVAAGGGSIVDCQPLNCGRDANQLHKLSVASGVKIVACTGYHLRQYYADDNAPLWDMTSDEARAFFVGEIRNGLIETRNATVIHPGFIKIAAEATFEASPRHLFEAAAVVAKETGYAIEMHTERGAAIENFLTFFAEQGLSPDRLVFCHVDKRADFGLHEEMVQAGVMMEYDTFYRARYNPEDNLWPLLSKMIDAGYADRVALATDMAGGELWSTLGDGPGLTAFMTRIGTRLRQMGIEHGIIAGLMGGNIARRLSVDIEQKE
ncbi:MAG: hypothetical protein AAF787_05840 [Chloroflexota bacterium]